MRTLLLLCMLGLGKQLGLNPLENAVQAIFWARRYQEAVHWRDGDGVISRSSGDVTGVRLTRYRKAGSFSCLCRTSGTKGSGILASDWVN